jgi:type VI secretion system secreted protein Hcp
MAIYMKFGSKVKGQVTTEGYKDMIELSSFQFGVGRAVGTGAGGAQREGSHPSVSEITVNKVYDLASAGLYQDALAGAFDTKVNIYLTTTTKNKTDTYLAYELTDCGLSGYSVSSGGDNPSESLSLNFTKIMVTPSPLDAAGKPVKGAIVTYDLKLLKTS